MQWLWCFSHSSKPKHANPPAFERFAHMRNKYEKSNNGRANGNKANSEYETQTHFCCISHLEHIPKSKSILWDEYLIFSKIIIKPIRRSNQSVCAAIHNPMIDLVAQIFRFRICTSVSFYETATAQHKRLKSAAILMEFSADANDIRHISTMKPLNYVYLWII